MFKDIALVQVESGNFMFIKIAALLFAATLSTAAMAGLEEGLVAYKEKDYATALKEFRPLAKKGNAGAQFNLGMMYYNGEGTPKDAAKTVEWWQKAADQGNLEAQYNLGWMYEHGEGVPKNAAKAIEWYQKAAAQNLAIAQFNLGSMYANGDGTPKNAAKAVEWWQKAAEQGHADAQYNLGGMHYEGIGVAKDQDEAVKWFHKAAKQGQADAQFSLGVMYATGQYVAKDQDEAIKWYRKAAEQGVANAQLNLGSAYGTGQGVAKNQNEAHKWYRKAAEQGNADGQYRIGFAYEYGVGVAKNQDEAIKWYRKAAEQGFAYAQFSVGEMYATGQGVAKDQDNAFKWYRKAAEQGYAGAQNRLGEAYANGDGVTKDAAMAVEWYRKAAEQGDAYAQNNLGDAYANGQGVIKDAAKAVEWYRKAAKQGNADAQFSIGYAYATGQGVPIDQDEAVKWYHKAEVQGRNNPYEPTTEPVLLIEPGGHTGRIQRIATDKAGRWLVTASIDKTARVWDMQDGSLATTLRIPIESGTGGKLSAVALSPDGETVAVGGIAILDAPKSNSIRNSIYLFKRASGQMLRRLTGLPETIFHLAFSHDGRWLAATMVGSNGVRVFDAASGKLLAEDRDYGGDSNSAQFSSDGRLVTTSFDGLLRLYRFDGKRLTLLTKRAAPGGKRPYSARFSPDGTRIAVGFMDMINPAVNVLNANDLSLEYAPDAEDAYLGLPVVAWSQDGAALYAAGLAVKDFDGNARVYIRRWASTNKGIPADWPVAENSITDLATLPDGRLAFGSGEPSWGVVNAEGTRLLHHAPGVADFREDYGSTFKGKPQIDQSGEGIVFDVNSLQRGFTLSADGARVHFNYAFMGKSSAVFDVLNRTFLAADTPGLTPPLLKFPGLEVTDWLGLGKTTTKLNGTALKLELDSDEKPMSLALLPRGDGFILGTSFNLRWYDRSGKRSGFSFDAPGVALQVNASADGRLVVAAFGDGTIRWFDASGRKELLAFYPHPDKKRWVMWTPEGYYDASPGGEDLIGWHLNQGKDKEARFIPGNQLYDVFFRPDIVQAKFGGDDISGLITITAAQALKYPPPVLSFTKMPSTTRGNTEKVCYKATSTGGGIGEIRLFQNGKLVKSDGFYRETVAKGTGINTGVKLAAMDSATVSRALKLTKSAQKAEPPMVSSSKGNEYSECQEIETIPGDNEISVAAFNANNTIQSSLETIHFTSGRKPEDPHLYVLGIGINKYKSAENNLSYAVKDATDFRTMIQDKAKGLFNTQNIHIQGLSDAQATKAGIRKAIEAISAKVKPWDSFILFVASHGYLHDNQYYIVTADFDGTVNTAKMISSNEIVGMSKNIKSLSQLLIFDTCHAGGVDNIIGGLYDARMSVMAKKMGLHIYASAGSTQTALDGFQGNGLFTHTLLKSMKAADTTDSNHDKEVSVSELGEQAQKETMAISKKLGFPQSPNIINFGKDNALFRVKRGG